MFMLVWMFFFSVVLADLQNSSCPNEKLKLSFVLQSRQE